MQQRLWPGTSRGIRSGSLVGFPLHMEHVLQEDVKAHHPVEINVKVDVATGWKARLDIERTWLRPSDLRDTEQALPATQQAHEHLKADGIRALPLKINGTQSRHKAEPLNADPAASRHLDHT
ncbi:hypothetical protein NDU88_000462 [Pleurodeles waltl]|uniref:Uncharacterized protein n=1 Tax=Pleurodeles waltl TaxID=8319 RepID=A0AAV7S9P3_PLEWA|nr:hypothetical protein NDU88_000462 [Pleurodeles waltl]